MTTSIHVEKEEARNEFLVWATLDAHLDLLSDGDGDFSSSYTQGAWLGWKTCSARAAASAAQVRHQLVAGQVDLILKLRTAKDASTASYWYGVAIGHVSAMRTLGIFPIANAVSTLTHNAYEHAGRPFPITCQEAI